MPAFKSRIVPSLLTVLLLVNSAWPWGSEGHSMINRVAAEKLPPDVPGFLRSAEDQLAYLGPEPDRWREKSELALKASQEPDHFINFEVIEGMALPPDRYSYYRALEAKRQQTPGQPASLLPEKVGLQPYITAEIYGRLVVAFREYRHAVRDHASTDFAERNAIFYAGWLGHYVADGSNPLHTTVNYNGWTTANPNGYTNDNTIHWKMEGQFVAANLKQLPFANLVPAQAHKLDDPFQDYLAYLHQSYGDVEKVYQLEKAGGFEGTGTPESRQFIEQRLAAGAQMLRDLWYTAWLNSAVDPQPYVPPKPANPTKPVVPKASPSSVPSLNMAPNLGEQPCQPGA